jgi:hypothetical protein
MLMPQTEDTQPVNARPTGAGEAQEAADLPAVPETLPEAEDFPVWLHSGG